MAGLPDIARRTSERHCMFVPGQVVVAMVSGGADSVALLRLLASGELAPELRLSVLHLDHMLRAADSTADAEFVRLLCDEIGVKAHIVRYDVAAYAEEAGLNLEDAGRRVRYRFAEEELDARCVAAGVPAMTGAVAVAHTLDDQIETFLMRLVTGSGPGGLSAIPPVRGRIVRPLIGARRADVLEYLETLGQDWREDATNADTTRLRARVRHDLAPVALAINPRFDQTVARSVAVIAEEDRLLDEMAEAFSRDFTAEKDGSLAFDKALMGTLSRAMARRAVRKAIVRVFPEASRLEFDHVESLVDALSLTAFSRDLPFGLRAWAEYGSIMVARQGEERPPLAPALLDIPGTADLGSGGVIRAEGADPSVIPRGPASVLVDASAIPGALTVDGPRQGDRMRPLGMRGTKKLQDLFVDEKVPKRCRSTVPVVRNGEDIVWVAGVRLSEDYRVTEKTAAAYLLVWEPPGSMKES